MKNKDLILNYLDELYPNARCELNYTFDYELLLATVLSSQTTDKKVNEVTKVLFNKYNTLTSIANANLDDIKKIIRPIGTYNKKAKFLISIANALKDYDRVPNDYEFLIKLPGVGRKTINVFLSNIYNEPVMAVDTHVNRVSKRLLIANEKDNVLEVENKIMKKFKKDEILKLHHQLIFFGRYKCKSQRPICFDCKLFDICGYEKKQR